MIKSRTKSFNFFLVIKIFNKIFRTNVMYCLLYIKNYHLNYECKFYNTYKWYVYFIFKNKTWYNIMV